MDDDDQLDAIAEKAIIEVSYYCDECKMEMRSEDEFDTDGYALAEVLFDRGWRVDGDELLCERCAELNKGEGTG